MLRAILEDILELAGLALFLGAVFVWAVCIQ